MNGPDLATEQAFERASAAAEARRRMLAVRGTGAGAGGLVTATVSGTGELLNLRIEPAALRLGPSGLGEAITAAARTAAEDATRRAYTVLALAVGDEATAEVQRRTPEQEPEPDDDLDTFDASVYPW